MVWMGQKSGVEHGEQGLRESPGWGKQCEPGWWSLRYGSHLLALLRGRLRKGIMASAWEKAPHQLLYWCQIIQFLPGCLWCLSIYSPSAGAQVQWVWVNLCLSPLRVTALGLLAFCFPQPQSLLVVTARSYRDVSSWHWNAELGGWDLLLLRYPSRFLSDPCGYGNSLLGICTPPTSYTFDVVVQKGVLCLPTLLSWPEVISL